MRGSESALFQRAVGSMPGGVASSFQLGDPYPIYLERGVGAEVWDVDGNEYFDFHNGFGSIAVGHANPIVAEAVEQAARSGMHFAVTVESTVAFAEELCRRFDVDQVRFTNSGTESNMTAIRVARAATGRDVIAKIEGSYHGHVDFLMYSVHARRRTDGRPRHTRSNPEVEGHARRARASGSAWCPSTTPPRSSGCSRPRATRSQCLIMEPVMMNIGIVLPAPATWSASGELCTQYGVVLIFDEVKCGCTIAAGGAT
jgi:glutamate-1-semialdehyde 2,1-aminomutase